ncbi:right-handed parallel beta-helix repeat-containing protein [Actinophytocola gossypii]|uniref:Right-handed parallel beta-helix repeat-containing protein n=1 Tax=Actinophytocola gossypii TaxID=2812003 RepID=A0ABT2JCZ0_9PSEU|nr:right-handed parallel beta-helix repeat-containing protein [Actinophytocola gossypii]
MTSRLWTAVGLSAALLLAGCTSTPVDERPVEEGPAGSVPAVCDHVRPGPAEAPAGAVTVDPAVDGDLTDKTMANPPGTTFWLAPGTHTLTTDLYGQVIPKDGNTYLGAPGAVLDGQGRNLFAFTQPASHVTIRHLTIQGFAAPHNQGVVNHDSGDDWVIEHNTIQYNDGAGMMAGARQRIRGNCLRENGQYGINAFSAGNTITGLVVEGNEIVGNNTDDWETQRPGCGCTGGVKFWAVDGADVRGNWVHDNRGPGLWGDINNNDFLIEHNLIEHNDGAAIVYEASYNAIIRDNTIRGNNMVEGRMFAGRGDPFPAATIYVSESGGEPRIPARTDRIEIHGNLLENNWSGITAWENADRFCNSPANPSGDCTLLAETGECAQPGIAEQPHYDDCRWKTQRLDVHHNRFVLDPTVVECSNSLCTRMAVLANYGTFPNWSPYTGDVVQEAVTFGQDNRWHHNEYSGPWTFMAYDTSGVLTQTKWQSEPYRQDEGSTFVVQEAG